MRVLCCNLKCPPLSNWERGVRRRGLKDEWCSSVSESVLLLLLLLPILTAFLVSSGLVAWDNPVEGSQPMLALQCGLAQTPGSWREVCALYQTLLEMQEETRSLFY